MLSTKGESIIEMCRYMRQELILGLLTQAEAISYVDSIIAKNEEVDSILIEISLSGLNNVNELIRRLGDFETPNASRLDGKVFIKLVADKYFSGKFNLEKAIRILYQIMLTNTISKEKEEETKIYLLDYHFDIIGISKMTEQEVKVELESFLLPYKDIRIPYVFSLI